MKHAEAEPPPQPRGGALAALAAGEQAAEERHGEAGPADVDGGRGVEAEVKVEVAGPAEEGAAAAAPGEFGGRGSLLAAQSAASLS